MSAHHAEHGISEAAVNATSNRGSIIRIRAESKLQASFGRHENAPSLVRMNMGRSLQTLKQ